MHALELVIGVLATWRITTAFVYDKGPDDIFLKLRTKGGVLSEFLRCPWCVSIWIGWLVSGVWLVPPDVVGWLTCGFALSGATALIEEVRGWLASASMQYGVPLRDVPKEQLLRDSEDGD